jgi:ABC-2 type transport system permease protein
VSSRTWSRHRLIAETVRGHRVSIVAWVLGGTAAMYGIALGYANEVARFPGGAKGMGESLAAAAEALRPLRWPADRLDTLGGYITYHNVTLFALFLAVWAAIQGARAVRDLELRHSLEEILATGRPRSSVVVDRTAGFLVALTLIVVGVGLGLGASMAAGGEPNLEGSLVTILAAGLCALPAYALGLLVSQVVGSARKASGISASIVTALYVYTNVWDRTGPFEALRFVSPFFHFDRSRALVPGEGADVASMVVLLAMATAGIAAGAWAFERRDYAARLWARPERRATGAVVRVQRPWLRRVWSATLVRERGALLAWAIGAALYMGLVAWLETAATDVWERMRFMRELLALEGVSASDQYLSLVSELLSLIVAAFVISHAAGWVADLREGRVEAILSGPISWSRLVWERLVALVVGVTVITAAAVVALAGGGAAAGTDLNDVGLLRLAGDTILFGASLGAVATIVVAWLRDRSAVLALSLFVVASYLLVLFVPLFDWPAWIERLSVFGALGHPYLELPQLGGLVTLGVLGSLGAVAGAAIATRTPKVA